MAGTAGSGGSGRSSGSVGPGGPGGEEGSGQGRLERARERAWESRLAGGIDRRVRDFTASVGFDRRLYREDVEGSKAHAWMLAEVGLLTREEAEALASALDVIVAEIEEGTFTPSPELEDIHMNIERRLEEKVGPLAGKLHTARSRNDQVALDLRLWLRKEIAALDALAAGVQAALIGLAERERETIMPGYTHLQRAQPVLFAHHLLAYFWMLDRDRGRLAGCLERVDISPLGAAALAGTGLPIRPDLTAQRLGMRGVFENSMEAVGDRDFALEFLSCGAILMTHLSRLAEEIVLWSSAEFGFVELEDRFATGSSIMPQKKNPDPAELIRAKSGRVFGNLVNLLTVLKALPLAYNRDLQEDKEPVFDTADTLRACLSVLAPLLETLSVRRDRMAAAALDGLAAATDMADYLAAKGMPFREAHRVVGGLVRKCVAEGKGLGDLSAAELKAASVLLDDEVLAILPPEGCVARRRSHGGTSPERVSEAVDRARSVLKRVPHTGGTGGASRGPSEA